MGLSLLKSLAAMSTPDSDYTHIERTYDEGSADYGSHFQGPHALIEPERRRFLEALPKGATILDCGCGPGMDTERFDQLGYQVVAIDVSARFVELTRARVPAARVLKMDMRNLEFGEATFDGTWLSFSLLHIRAEETPGTLLGLRAVLRPDGVLLAALHRSERTAWVKRVISGMERETYVQEWSQPEAEKVFQKAGFEILSSRPFLREGGRYPLLGILARR
jgi:ubiquinone/menaquinone biosynthesis C-methylase UbiE